MLLCAYDQGGPVAQMAGSDAAWSPPDNLRELPHMGTFVLPGGYVDDRGAAHYEVEMSPVTGKVEEYLGSLPGSTTLASAATALLTRCVKRVGSIETITPLLIGDLLVGDRDYLIMRLREMTFGPRVDAMIQCPHPVCGKTMDLSFSLDDIVVERKALKRRTFRMDPGASADEANLRSTGGLEVEFELPTGALQEAASALVGLSETSAIDRLLSLCVKRVGNITDVDETIISALPSESRQQIEDAIRRQTPSVEIEFEAECPDCHRAFLFPVDFTRFFFAEMKDNLRTLEFEVHLLAKTYHWGEGEILSMARNKRQRYISLLRQEMDL